MKGSRLHLLQSKLHKTQFKTTTIQFMILLVDNLGCAQQGLLVSSVSFQFGLGVTCLSLGSHHPMVQVGTAYMLPEGSRRAQAPLCKCLSSPCLFCVCLHPIAQCNHMGEFKVEGYLDFHRRDMGTGKGRNSSYLYSHCRTGFCIAKDTLFFNSLLQGVLGWDYFLVQSLVSRSRKVLFWTLQIWLACGALGAVKRAKACTGPLSCGFLVALSQFWRCIQPLLNSQPDQPASQFFQLFC